MSATFPVKRPRRLRSRSFLRDLVAQTTLSANDFLLPLFVRGENCNLPTDSFLGIPRYSVDECKKVLENATRKGIKAAMLFPVIEPEKKDETGSYALRPDGFLPSVLRELKKEKFPIALCVDIALDPYTLSGHDGVLATKDDIVYVHNDLTLEALGQMSLVHAQSGADVLCPSDMMDGRIAHIRKILDAHNFIDVSLLSYAVKYASSLYGPFRHMVGATLSHDLKDKKTYQMDYRNEKEALQEVMLDDAEGADMLIIKPGLPYLDILTKAVTKTTLPIFAYQVSGEYAMIKCAAQYGYVNERDAFLETAFSFKRAGASAIITYAALDIIDWLNN